MKTPTRLFGALSIMLLFFLTSCASTKVTGEWKDPNFSSQKFKKIMVIGAAKQPTQRKSYEDKFVRQLEAKGIMAISSHTLIPHDKMRDKATVVQTIEGMGIDGVIVTRVRDITEKQQHPRRDHMDHYYDTSLGLASSYRKSSPTYKQKFSFESKLYDTKTEKLVFSLSSNTSAQDNIEKHLGSYIKKVVNKLIQNNLL